MGCGFYVSKNHGNRRPTRLGKEIEVDVRLEAQIETLKAIPNV